MRSMRGRSSARVARARILATCDYRENVMIESKKEFYFFVGIGVMIIAAGAAVLTRFI